MSVALGEIEELVGGLAVEVGPKVVGVGRFGSGMVIGDGRILTNAHVVRPEEVQVRFADGRTATGAVTGLDPDADLAVISADTQGIEPLEWADEAPGIGAVVVAVANPGGRGLRATLGFVSSSGRSFRGPRGRRRDSVEHTAPLPRGSSGSPGRRQARPAARNQHHPARGWADRRDRRHSRAARARPGTRARGVSLARDARSRARAAARRAPVAAGGRTAGA